MIFRRRWYNSAGLCRSACGGQVPTSFFCAHSYPSAETDVEPGKTSASLISLRLKGLIKQLPGSLYIKVYWFSVNWTNPLRC